MVRQIIFDGRDEFLHINLVARNGRFAPHFHLPLQHASDAVLRLMRRPYTSGYYHRLVSDVRERLPDAAIGSDMIVGFPGETDADADANLAYLGGSPLTYLHVFPYSDRPGTDATRMRGKVPGPVIRERGRALRAAGAELAAAFRASQLGKVRSGLTTDGRLRGGDRQLPQGQGAGGPARQPPRAGAHHRRRRVYN